LQLKYVLAKIAIVSIIRNFILLVRNRVAEKGDAQRAGLWAGVALVFRPPTTDADKSCLFEVKN